MEFEIILNQEQAEIKSSGGVLWTCYYDTAQKFILKVTANNEADVGQKIGLTQTLLASSRVATYATGGQLYIEPTAGVPCLDGDDSMIPWYNVECECKKLQNIDSEISFTLEDSPSTNVPSQGVDSQGVKQNITKLKVAESFLVTLYNNEIGAKIRQWTWSYGYELTPNGSVYAKPVVELHNEAGMERQVDMLGIVVEGPVATSGVTDSWTPEGWGAPD
jgi:hypothetical protein